MGRGLPLLDMAFARGSAPLLSLGLLSFVMTFGACGDDAPPAQTTAPTGTTQGADAGAGLDGTAAQDVVQPDAASAEAAADADAAPASGPPPIALPVSYQRPDTGNPLTPAELTTATDELIAILKDTRFFDFADERIHGWPESDPNGGFFWGTFWTGVSVSKSGGVVTYKHSNDGSDNAGIHTAPYLEGTCWAHLLYGDAKTAKLVRRTARGLSAWILAMERQAGDTTPRLLSRAFYPPNVSSNDGGRNLVIDYSASRPGIDAEPSDYVHLPNNPTFGDIYVKNKRSKDDIGHMLRAISQVQACSPRLDAAGQADLAQLESLYTAWAKEVDARNFVIPTRDKNGDVYNPTLQLANYMLVANAECASALAIRLFHSGANGNLACGNGISAGEKLAMSFLKNDARQIMRTHHAAAVVAAHRKTNTQLGLELLQGLGERIDLDMGFVESGSPPSGFNPQDVTSFLIYAASVGVPLTSREVRWLHGRLHEAYVGMRDPVHANTFRVFDPATPDGNYSFDPPNIGLFYNYLPMMLGTCASPYRNPTARALIDCDRIRSTFSP